MSWISKAWNWLNEQTGAGARLLGLLREKAPQVIPFLLALAEDDHDRAADILLTSGTGQEIMAKVPADMRDYLRLTAPYFCQMLDGLIPEGNVLHILEGVGVDVTPDEPEAATPAPVETEEDEEPPNSTSDPVATGPGGVGHEDPATEPEAGEGAPAEAETQPAAAPDNLTPG